MAELILFDLDGTLTDSGPGIMDSIKYMFEQLKLPVPSPEELRTFVGPPIVDKLQEVTDLTPEEAVEAVKLYRAHYRAGNIWNNSVYEGIPEVLSILQMSGKKLGVASSKPHDMVEKVLEKYDLTQYFDVIRGSQAEGPKAAKVEVLKDALAIAGYADKLDQVVLVGDTKYDAIGAKQIGITCVGVTYGYGTHKELKENGAVNICKTPGELVFLAFGDTLLA